MNHLAKPVRLGYAKRMERNNREAKKHQRYTPRPPWRPGSVYEKVECKSPKWPLRRPTKEEAEGRKLIPIRGNSLYALRITKAKPFVEVVSMKQRWHSRIKPMDVLTSSRLPIGYHTVHLHEKSRGNAKTLYLHRLLAEALYGRLPTGTNVCHLNGDREDNMVENLVIATPKENQHHRYIHGTSLGAIRSKSVAIKIAEEYWSGSNMSAISRKFGCSRPTVKSIMTGKSWSHLAMRQDHRNRRIGSANPNSKLNERQVVIMRRMHKSGNTIKSLSRIFGVSPKTASMIVYGLLWKQVL